jgi:hypothetical protein
LALAYVSPLSLSAPLFSNVLRRSFCPIDR